MVPAVATACTRSSWPTPPCKHAIGAKATEPRVCACNLCSPLLAHCAALTGGWLSDVWPAVLRSATLNQGASAVANESVEIHRLIVAAGLYKYWLC